MFEKIAVPLDGSEFGEMALPWAVNIAVSFHSEIHLLSVSENEVIEEKGMRPGYLDHKAEIIRHEIRARSGTGEVKPIVMEGAPANKIIDYVQTEYIDLLVLVSHGRSGIMPWPMGSTAARILSMSTKPVLFIRANKLVVGPPLETHILVALDGSLNGESVLPYIKQISTRMRSNVTLFRVVPSFYEIVTTGGVRSVDLPHMEIERRVQEANEYLEKIKTSFNTNQVNCAVRTGPAANEIVNYARDNEVNVIAITSRGQSKVGGWRLGEVAHKVLHVSSTPIFMVKVPPGK
jgi:nucleotide-binding universal stress UspA family protein